MTINRQLIGLSTVTVQSLPDNFLQYTKRIAFCMYSFNPHWIGFAYDMNQRCNFFQRLSEGKPLRLEANCLSPFFGSSITYLSLLWIPTYQVFPETSFEILLPDLSALNICPLHPERLHHQDSPQICFFYDFP